MTSDSTSTWSTHLSGAIWSLNVAVPRKGPLGCLLYNDQNKRSGGKWGVIGEKVKLKVLGWDTQIMWQWRESAKPGTLGVKHLRSWEVQGSGVGN